MKKQWMVLAVIAMGCLSAYAQAVSGNATMNGIDVLNQREAQLNDGLYAAAGNKVERAYWELTPEDELLDSTVSVSATGVRGYKVVYFYDSLRRLDYTLHYEGICPNRQLKNKDQYTYDGYGNKGSWEVLFWFNSSWLSLQLHEWQYSADGDMLLYNYRNIQRYEWVYEAPGKIKSALRYRWFGGAWLAEEMDTYDYNKQGNVELKELKLYYDSVWYNRTKTFYSYDVNDSLIEVENHFWRDSIWENQSKTCYVYGQNGIDKSVVNYSFTAGDWALASKNDYVYDPNGWTIQHDNYTWSSGAWQGVKQILYGYDTNGNVLMREEKSWQNGTWVDSQKFIFTYNANNQVTSEHIYHISGGSWVVVTERLYTYNVNNNIIQFVESRLENDGWLERSRVYYYYSVHKTPVAVEDVQTDKDLCYVTADRTMMWKQAGYVEVYTSLGQLLYKGYTNSVAVKQSGVYLVRRDGVTEKIVVR